MTLQMINIGNKIDKINIKPDNSTYFIIRFYITFYINGQGCFHCKNIRFIVKTSHQIYHHNNKLKHFILHEMYRHN